jgi:hypothetical protein
VRYLSYLQGGSLLGLSFRKGSDLQDNNCNYTLFHKNHMIYCSQRRPRAQSSLFVRSRMCNSYGPTRAVSRLSVLFRAMQSRTVNCKTAVQLNDGEEVSLFRDPRM